jgi:hypothetical protein
MSKTMLSRSLVAAAAAAAAFAPCAQARSAKAHPKILAKPDSVMVNQSTTLIGTGFPKRSEVTLSECSRETWIAPQNPCEETNQVTVKTNGTGAFKTSFKALLCEPSSTPPNAGPTERTCFIGEIQPTGVDTIELLGAVRISVTYP